MACFKPVPAVRLDDGRVVMVGRDTHKITFDIPCGQCVGCRLDYARSWALRCVHEAKLHEQNCVITLTYDDAHLPVAGNLQYSDYQFFMKRLRRRFFSSTIRFFMSGEYGEANGRPHYHALLFGFDFSDKSPTRKAKNDSQLYSSKMLDEVWRNGRTEIGEMSYESAAYVARYVMKKVNGDEKDDHYRLPVPVLDTRTGELVHYRVPEFCHMSLKPGIGSDWFRLNWQDVVATESVIVNGKEAPIPLFYKKKIKGLAAMKAKRAARMFDTKKSRADQTPARLAVRAKVAQARLNLNKREMK